MTGVVERTLPWAAIAFGAAAVAARRPAAGATVAVVMVGFGALLVRVPATQPRMARWLGAVVVGAAVFAAARWLGGGPALGFTAATVLANTVAAVAEEALFRRAMFGRLEHLGPGFAVAVTAVVFGVVHVPLYGWAVMPIDVAAGVVFGWQRWATGTWTAPAATHVFANLVQLG